MSYYDKLLAVLATYGEPPVSGGKFIFPMQGAHSFYLTTSGALYGCGLNGNYQLGNGSSTDVQTWTQLVE